MWQGFNGPKVEPKRDVDVMFYTDADEHLHSQLAQDESMQYVFFVFAKVLFKKFALGQNFNDMVFGKLVAVVNLVFHTLPGFGLVC